MATLRSDRTGQHVSRLLVIYGIPLTTLVARVASDVITITAIESLLTGRR